ncbi:unnamed protein product [Macrosiphum euphorbiae]|uniref:Capsid protein n=1 Tax=Macrosiphum euphorbiae TaxID=13131 RepID=A0AAV0Y457_9HEMI|nr:unnamed protein product [Macrosiphum euphorbiae]
MRNPRTAFETNVSTSNLATLNQNKFIQHATGLVNCTRGFNTVYEFATATNPMVPTSCKIIDTTFMKKVISAISNMYGTKNDDWLKPNWSAGATLPCSFMNLLMQFPAYYTMYANSAQNQGKIGWQNINEHVTKMDASAVIGTTIIDSEYTPTLSYLSMPWKAILGRAESKDTNKESFNLADTNSIALPNSYTMDNTNGTCKANVSNNYSLLTDTKWKQLFSDNFNRYIEPIECGQYIKQGLHTSTSVKIQPSLHIGVCPVPQLTTTNANFVPDKFTDIECLWDIETELICEYGLPYKYTTFPDS